eukprot:1156004-Pelagomonas_calceolata.AAC.3
MALPQSEFVAQRPSAAAPPGGHARWCMHAHQPPQHLPRAPSAVPSARSASSSAGTKQNKKTFTIIRCKEVRACKKTRRTKEDEDYALMGTCAVQAWGSIGTHRYIAGNPVKQVCAILQSNLVSKPVIL